MSLWAKLSAVFNDDIAPWFEHLFSQTVANEVTALLPLASSAAGALAADLATNSGNLSAFAKTASAILQNTATQAEAAAIQAGGTSLLTAVTSAIATHTQAVGLGGTPIPPAPAPKTGSGTFESPPVNAEGLRTDGPTLAEYETQGYDASTYPPEGFASKEPAAE